MSSQTVHADHIDILIHKIISFICFCSKNSFHTKHIDTQFKDLVELRKICYLAAAGFGCLTCVFVFPFPSQLRLLNKPTPLLPKSTNLKIPQFSIPTFHDLFRIRILHLQSHLCLLNKSIGPLSSNNCKVKAVWFNSG